MLGSTWRISCLKWWTIFFCVSFTSTVIDYFSSIRLITYLRSRIFLVSITQIQVTVRGSRRDSMSEATIGVASIDFHHDVVSHHDFPLFHADRVPVSIDTDRLRSRSYLYGFDVPSSCRPTSFPNGTHSNVRGVTEFERSQSCGIGTQSFSHAAPETYVS